MLKIVIVGAGKIADAHAAEMQRVAGCQLVGVCDREPLMAAQLAERFGVATFDDDLERLLIACQPDVVHITTPPRGHFEIARQCLRHGCHVYVEKPFTLRAMEAEELLALAETLGLKLTVGHDAQFSHVARRLRESVRQGALGGDPVHMESYYCYNLGKDGYAQALLADKQHWVRRLPGGLLQNIISHGIARIAEYLRTDQPTIVAHGFVSPLLREMGETEIIDELRVIISDESLTAYFTFSSQMRPALNMFRIYGPKGGLILDQNNETLVRLTDKRFKSYAEHFLSPLVLARQYGGNVASNVRRFLASDFHMKAGMKHLFERFYESISTNAEPPIPYREILLTARIMESIFAQLGTASRAGGAPSAAPVPDVSTRTG